MNFPKNWFFIRNRNNNYALSIERSSPGESVIISTLKESDNDLQLWRCDENGRIHNKMTGFVLDVGQGAFVLYIYIYIFVLIWITHFHIRPCKSRFRTYITICI